MVAKKNLKFITFFLRCSLSSLNVDFCGECWNSLGGTQISTFQLPHSTNRPVYGGSSRHSYSTDVGGDFKKENMHLCDIFNKIDT